MKNALLKAIPLKHHLPLRYLYEKLTGNLEYETTILTQIAGEGKLAIDIGANFGIYTFALSKICSRVVTFEPLPACAETIKAYNAPNVEVHNVGLSSSKGHLTLFTPIVNGTPYTAWSSFSEYPGEHERREVPVHTVDDYGFEEVAFVKIDVEGHELEVLKGAAATIRRDRPVLLIEIEQRHLKFPMSMVFDHILDYGYKGFFYQNAKRHPLSEFSYERLQQPFLDNTGDKAYVNNFLFLP